MCALGLSGCFHSGDKEPRPTRTEPRGPLAALDAQHRRLVAGYQPVSRKLYEYEVAFRDWERGVVPATALAAEALGLRTTVSAALPRVTRPRAGGETEQARALLESALRARLRALDALLGFLAGPGSTERAPPAAYLREWNASVVFAREALTLLQDVRDRERLTPLPEDSVS
jgi:hypothetical protein